MSVSSISSGPPPTQIQPSQQPVTPVKPVKRDSDGDNDTARADNDSDDAGKSKSLDSQIKAAVTAGSSSQGAGKAPGSYVNITA